MKHSNTATKPTIFLPAYTYLSTAVLLKIRQFPKRKPPPKFIISKLQHFNNKEKSNQYLQGSGVLI